MEVTNGTKVPIIEAPMKPSMKPREGHGVLAGVLNLGMLLLPPDGDDDGREHKHEHAGKLHDGGDVHRAECVAARDRVGDFVQGSTGGDAQLVYWSCRSAGRARSPATRTQYP